MLLRQRWNQMEAKGSKRWQRELRVLDMKGRKDAFGNDVYAILHTQKGLLVGSLAGLRLNQRQILLTPGAQPLVNALAYDAKRHCYWIGTEGALYCADQALQNFSKIAALDGNSVKCLDEDQDGNLYIGTDNGLYRMAMNNSLEHFVHDSRMRQPSPTISYGPVMWISGRMCGSVPITDFPVYLPIPTIASLRLIR